MYLYSLYEGKRCDVYETKSVKRSDLYYRVCCLGTAEGKLVSFYCAFVYHGALEVFVFFFVSPSSLVIGLRVDVGSCVSFVVYPVG